MKLSNWTNYPISEVEFSERSSKESIVSYLEENDSFITRGNGRCYGDASLGDNVLSILGLNAILSFDSKSGVLHCQSGLLFSDILDAIVPKGWFLPVSPGTKFITVGGAIASNVHGKNHHKEGAFSKHVLEIELLLPNGEIAQISEETNSQLFNLTCGGMGLTGIILSGKIQLKPIETAFIKYKSIKARSLKEVIALFEKNKNYTYSMAWIDCLQKGENLGRSILMLGEHALENEISNEKSLLSSNKTLFTMPFNLPSWVLNPFSIRAFNFFYYNKQLPREQNKIVHYDGFFYPLDAILEWNKMYGKKGFIQYQPVFPIGTSYESLKEVLEKIASSGFGSFLAVLKLMGKEDNKVSFPMEGYTLALDFPIKKGLFEFLEELDDIVMKYGGRLYLSKDARMTESMFKSSYESSTNMVEELKTIDPKGKLSSGLSKRLKLK